MCLLSVVSQCKLLHPCPHPQHPAAIMAEEEDDDHIWLPLSRFAASARSLRRLSGGALRTNRYEASLLLPNDYDDGSSTSSIVDKVSVFDGPDISFIDEDEVSDNVFYGNTTDKASSLSDTANVETADSGPENQSPGLHTQPCSDDIPTAPPVAVPEIRTEYCDDDELGSTTPSSAGTPPSSSPILTPRRMAISPLMVFDDLWPLTPADVEYRRHWRMQRRRSSESSGNVAQGRPVAQVPQCTCPISHSTPFSNRNGHICYISVTKWCVVGY